jgi:hypothetical protein
MEMPKGCGYCPIANFGYCSINHKKVGDPLIGYPENRPANCPIIRQLPEGHGRLVDKDEMLKKIENYHRYMTVGRESDPRCIIEDSPTIVPAEAERSET